MGLEAPLRKIAVFGAGGFGREVAWLISEINRVTPTHDLIGFVDDDPELKGRVVGGHAVLGGLGILGEIRDVAIAVAVGDPSTRLRIAERLKAFGVLLPNLIHPSVLVGEETSMGEGNILCAGVIITVNVRIGNFCHLNLKSTVGHDCVLEDFATAACGVDLAGDVRLGQGVYLGNHATVLPSVRVGPGSVIGAGAVVNRDVRAGSVCVGVPARAIRTNPAFQSMGGPA
ncbi:MAG: acetyltransferase [Thermodesulfobacteriota bacterium]